MSIPEYVGDIFQSLDIILDKKVYAPGDVLSGRVTLNLSSAVLNHGISINIKGYTSVGWPSAQQHHYATECYFDELKELLPPDEKKIFPAGSNYEYSFEYTLPLTIPSSVDFQHAKIVYFCQARLGDYKSRTVYFIVIRERDLRLLSKELEEPAGRSDKVFKPEGCMGCCPAESGEGEMTIPKTGYVPGEFIIVNATITNKSNIPTKSTKVYLKQTVVSYAKFVKKVEENVLAKITKECIQPNKSQVWTNECLIIPDVPSSKLKGCTIIDVSYRVEMTVFTYAGAAMTMQIPIEIGTIPIREDYIDILKATSKIATLYPSTMSDTICQQEKFETIELEREPLLIQEKTQTAQEILENQMSPISTSWTEMSTPISQEFSTIEITPGSTITTQSKQWSFSTSSKVLSKVETTKKQRIICEEHALHEFRLGDGEKPLLYVTEEVNEELPQVISVTEISSEFSENDNDVRSN